MIEYRLSYEDGWKKERFDYILQKGISKIQVLHCVKLIIPRLLGVKMHRWPVFEQSWVILCGKCILKSRRRSFCYKRSLMCYSATQQRGNKFQSRSSRLLRPFFFSKIPSDVESLHTETNDNHFNKFSKLQKLSKCTLRWTNLI